MNLRSIYSVILLVIFSACTKHKITPPEIAVKGEVAIKAGDTSGSTVPLSTFRTTDNNFLVSGFVFTGNIANPFILKFSNNLSLIYTKSFSGINGQVLQSIEANNSIYSLIAEEIDDTAPKYNDIDIVKTDLSGNVIWSKNYDKATFGTSLTKLADGNILVQGCYGTDVNNIQDGSMFLMKIDEQGNILFRKDFTGKYYFGSHDIIEDTNTYTLIAYQAGTIPTVSTRVPVLLKIDFSGNIISSHPFDQFMGTSQFTYNSFHLRQKIGGGYILTTSYTNIINPAVGGVEEAFFSLKILTADGSVIKYADIADNLGGQVDKITDLIQTQNGSIYTLLTHDSNLSFYSTIRKFDSNGHYLISNTKPLALNETAVSVLESDNNNIMLVFLNYPVNSVSVFRMDPNFNLL